MFREVDPKQSFPKMEEALVAYWEENKTFEKSIETPGGNKNPEDFVFYDGPPFATGLPHYGHLLPGTIKDVVPRYWTMRGYRVPRVWGWDCHGLPIENMIEKELGLQSKKDIETYGVDKFNEACRDSVLKYEKEWKKTVPRMGRWVDMENSYKTMDTSFTESIWWAFKELYKKGMVYEGRKPMHVCPRCETPLSNFEITLNYREVKDPSVIWKFKVKNQHNTYLLAWTTTPWSTASTMGLSIGPEFDYVKVKTGDEFLIFAKNRLEFVKGDVENFEVVETLKGKEIVGWEYEPIVDDFKKLPEMQNNQNVYHVFPADYVEVEEGTGIVTINGSYGEIDMEAAQKNGLPIVMDVDMNGRFNDKLPAYKAMYVKDMEHKLIEDMEKEGKVWRHEPYKHSYPHCWRCDTPLVNYAAESWFIAATQVKEKMLKSNQKIHWSPGHIKDGRFGKWLENIKDWSISRGRYWGSTIPIWRNVDEPSDILVVGSIDELEKLSGTRVNDLHKHIVDEVEIRKDGKTYRRIPEVFDCWVESGSMPYAQLHYPFENKKKFEKNFPADFIAEGVDQTRLWFYVLHVLGNALFDSHAFQNVIVNGIVLAENGQKMSKRLKNYPDPQKVIDRYGADALRFYLLNSQAVAAGDLRFSEHGVEHVLKNMMLPLWNAYSFFVTYANIDGWEPEKAAQNSTNKLDKWILAELNQLIAGQVEYFEAYDLQKASNAIYKFVDDLCNWYIRRSRRRFWKSEDDADKNQAYSTLYEVLTKMSQVLAPFTPFMPEAMYRNLTDAESVHLTAYPKPDESLRNETLIHEIRLSKTIVSLGLAARAKKRLKVRQPLRKIEVVLTDPADHALLKDQITSIREELNVKKVEFISDASDFATRIVKPNAKLLGPKYGAEVQKIIREAKAGNFEELGNGHIKVMEYELTPDEIAIDYEAKSGFDVESGDGLLVALDTEVTHELKHEGLARDLVRQIQELRKKAGYRVDDRIQVALRGADRELLARFGDTIQGETLATLIETVLEAPDESTEYEGMTIQVRKSS